MPGHDLPLQPPFLPFAFRSPDGRLGALFWWGVNRRSVWLFLAAILWNVAYSQLPRIVLFNFPELEDGYLDWLLTLVSPTLAKMAVALLPFLVLVSLRRR